MIFKSYALYKEEKSFNVIKGRVPDFTKNKNDLELAVVINGVNSTKFPKKIEGLAVKEIVCSNGVGKWDHESWSINVSELDSSKVSCTLYFETSFAKYLMELKEENGVSTLSSFSHEATEQTGELTDYRYRGSNPKNYICFGSDASPCPDENLYRIIGVIPTQSSEDGRYIDRVKLIKAMNYDGSTALKSTETESKFGYYWSPNQAKNIWEESILNTEVLNTEYWGTLSSKWQEYIAPTKWYLGAVSNKNYKTYTAKEIYMAERSTTQGYSKGALSTIANIGLMYPSDFGYATSGNLTTAMYDYVNYSSSTCVSSSPMKLNYLFQGELDGCGKVTTGYPFWTISPEATYVDGSGSTVWAMITEGYMRHKSPKYTYNVFGIRPVFHLKTDVFYSSGDGSKANPYRIV